MAQAEVRVGKNYRIASDDSPFRGTDQVNLAVNPSNPQHIVATNVNFLTEHCEASASFDGGATWSPAFDLLPPTGGDPFMPSCRVSDHAGESMFEGVNFGSGNTVYATSITPRAPGGVEQGASSLVYKSTDGGVTWARGVVALPGGLGSNVATGPYYELPSVLVQPGAGTGGADIVYSIARDASGSANSAPPATCAGGGTTRCDQIRIARSLDGGQTFGPPVNVSPPGVPTIDHAAATIDANGNLSVTWRTVGAPSPNPATTPRVGEIHFTRSTNQGQTWSAPVVITKVSNLARSSASPVTPLASSASSFPVLAVDKQSGNLYIVYNQQPPGPTAPDGGYQGTDHFIPPDSHVWFQRSLNNGATWSTPKRINDATIHQGTRIVQTRHPSVSVAPNGRVDIVWEDRRHWYHGPGERMCVHTHIFCDDARLGDTYYAYSTNAGGTFTERRISDHSHNNDVGYDYRFATYWAFGPRAVPLGNGQLLVGWMDSREGSYDTDNQDFYLAKVDHNATGAVPQNRIDEPDDVSLSVALSRRTYIGGGEGAMLSGFATRNATRVVIVNQNDTAGALAASVLARAHLAPVLLSSAAGLSPAVRAEVARLKPAGAYVIGDGGKLSDQVVADLAAAGVPNAQIERLSGGSDAATAAAIATELDLREDAERTADAPAFDEVVIANPASPDAYAAAGLAAARRLPFLFVNQNSVPGETANALAALDIDDTLVIGGTDQVSNTVSGAVPSPERLGGNDQYATSQQVVAESLQRGLPSNVVYVASGNRPMDAALLGFAVARSTGIQMLAPGSVSQTAPGTASGAGLTGIDQFVVVEASAAQPPQQPGPPPPPPPPPAPGAAAGKLTAKLALARATINRRQRVLDVLAPITSLASGRVNVELHAAGQRYRFTAAINSRDGRIRFRQRIPAAQARKGTGILTIRYNGDDDTRPQTVRLRAANRRADLTASRPTLAANGRLRTSGRISSLARGVVRIQLEYFADGKTTTLPLRARIDNGRWSLNERLSDAARAAIGRRVGTVHSYILFTGYEAARMRGEMRSLQVLGNR